MPYTSGTDGTRIHFREIGSAGPCVVLLHGLGLSGRFWFSLPERIAGAASGPRRVLVVDNRGTGYSDCPRRPWRARDMADDVAAVLDAAGIDHAVIAGTSMGGMIAQHTALRHPGRVRGLVLLATSAGMPHGRLTSLRTVFDLVSLPLIDEQKAGRTLARILLPPCELGNATRHLEGWREALLEEAAGTRGFFLQLAAVLGHAAGFRLKRIRCPTVVMTGDQDTLMPPKNSEILARLIPGAHLEVLPDVGHGIELLDPDSIVRAVDRVLVAGFTPRGAS